MEASIKIKFSELENQLDFLHANSTQRENAIDKMYELSSNYNFPGNVWWEDKDSFIEAIENGDFNPDDHFSFYEDGYDEQEVTVKIG